MANSAQLSSAVLCHAVLFPCCVVSCCAMSCCSMSCCGCAALWPAEYVQSCHAVTGLVIVHKAPCATTSGLDHACNWLLSSYCGAYDSVSSLSCLLVFCCCCCCQQSAVVYSTRTPKYMMLQACFHDINSSENTGSWRTHSHASAFSRICYS